MVLVMQILRLSNDFLNMIGLILFKIIAVFILGLIFGSFGQVVVERGQNKKSLSGRSECDSCGKKIAWYDNIPLLSYVLLKGRCRNCGKKISWRYPATELLFGVVFVLVAWQKGFIFGWLDQKELIDTIFYLAISFVLLVILIWDLRYMIIPDGLVVGGLVLAVIYFGYRYLISPDFLMALNTDLTRNFLGGLIVGGFFYFLFTVSRGRWIGGGDVKLGFLLGFLVGWKMSYLFLMLSYILGAVPAVYLLLTKKVTPKTKIPFGPFLILAGFILMLWGEVVWRWWGWIVSP